jgi:hypothetical protein
MQSVYDILLSMRATFLLLLVSLAPAPAWQSVTLSNDRIEVAIATRGGSMTSLVLNDDPGKISPFGDPARMGRNVLGHFVCVDGFGPSSRDERAAGLPGHGEAHRQPWGMEASGRQGKVQSMRFVVKLPIVQETFTRTLTLADGENIVYVDSELESWLGFDRPVNWGEHPSIAAPFLEPEKVVVDVSGRRSKTRAYDPAAGQRRTLASFRDFEWPMAPLAAGGVRDIRSAPADPDSLDHVTTLVDPAREHGWVTALHTGRQLLLGYLFRRQEYPWVQDWQSYPPDLRMYRGLEFATQPFDVPRRETVELNAMFDSPTYRWLPAKGKIGSRFLMFWTRTPPGMTRVDDVRLEGGLLVIEDRAAGRRIALPASLGL